MGEGVALKQLLSYIPTKPLQQDSEGLVGEIWSA